MCDLEVNGRIIFEWVIDWPIVDNKYAQVNIGIIYFQLYFWDLSKFNIRYLYASSIHLGDFHKQVQILGTIYDTWNVQMCIVCIEMERWSTMWNEGSIHTENNNGPRIDPWGTPRVTTKERSHRITHFLLDRYKTNNLKAVIHYQSVKLNN